MWGIKVIIPNKLQGRVLEELHTGHIRRNCKNESLSKVTYLVARYGATD